MESEKNCLFCKFVKKEITTAICFENENILAFMDINPAGKLSGHTLVIPKQHFNSITDCDDKTLFELIKTIKLLVPAIKKVSGADGVNIVRNEGKAAGEFVFHLHFHIIPRKHGDGIRFDTDRRNAKPMELTKTAIAINKEIIE
jgi:histidine triad (HIT) family protein